MYTICGLLFFFHEIYVNEGEMVKKVKFFQNVTLLAEILKVEVLLIFFESSFWKNKLSFFTNSCFVLTLRLVTYVYICFY